MTAVVFAAMLVPMTFGQRLAWLRGLVNNRPSDIAALAGITTSGLHLLEKGHRSPMVDTAASLARVYGCSLDWLCEGVGEPPTAYEVREAIEAARAQVG